MLILRDLALSQLSHRGVTKISLKLVAFPQLPLPERPGLHPKCTGALTDAFAVRVRPSAIETPASAGSRCEPGDQRADAPDRAMAASGKNVAGDTPGESHRVTARQQDPDCAARRRAWRSSRDWARSKEPSCSTDPVIFEEVKYVEGHLSGVAVPVAAQGGSQLACPLVGEEYAPAVDLDDLVGAWNGVA